MKELDFENVSIDTNDIEPNLEENRTLKGCNITLFAPDDFYEILYEKGNFKENADKIGYGTFKEFLNSDDYINAYINFDINSQPYSITTIMNTDTKSIEKEIMLESDEIKNFLENQKEVIEEVREQLKKYRDYFEIYLLEKENQEEKEDEDER